MSLLGRPLRLGPDHQRVAPGFVVAEVDTVLWAFPTSWSVRSRVRRGDVFLATSFVKQVGPWTMLPVHGGGAVEAKSFRAAMADDLKIAAHVVVLDLDSRIKVRCAQPRRVRSTRTAAPPCERLPLPPDDCCTVSDTVACSFREVLLKAVRMCCGLTRKDRNRLMHALFGNWEPSRKWGGPETSPPQGGCGEGNAARFFGSSDIPKIAGMAPRVRARGPRRARAEVLHREVRILGVAEPHPPLQREALAQGIGNRVAEPRVAQQLRWRKARGGPAAGTLPRRLHGLPQRRLLRLVHVQPPLVLRELVRAAARQVVQQLRVLQRAQHRRAPESVLHGGQLLEVPAAGSAPDGSRRAPRCRPTAPRRAA